jgi:hypothetical protein
MSKTASKFVEQAVAWIGMKESNGTHKQIIDIYNSQRPLPVGYAVKYNDAWCATFVSAVAVKLGYTDIIPCECSCPRMITLFKKKGIWVENEDRVPNPGDIIFYDWDDKSASGDNIGSPEHVGIVEKVSGGYITIIEGNYSNSVKRRTLSVNGRYIRGYGVPKYDPEATNKPTTNTETKTEVKIESTTSKGESTVNVELNVLKKGSKGNQVKALQRMLHAMGYNIGSNPIDGDFGSKTDTAVRAYQKKKSLAVDGIVGAKTWNKLLKG